MRTRYDQLTDIGKARRHRATAEQAIAAYGLAGARLKQLAVDSNFVFKVTAPDGRRFALRVSRHGMHTPEQIALELSKGLVLPADTTPLNASPRGRSVTSRTWPICSRLEPWASSTSAC